MVNDEHVFECGVNFIAVWEKTVRYIEVFMRMINLSRLCAGLLLSLARENSKANDKAIAKGNS